MSDGHAGVALSVQDFSVFYGAVRAVDSVSFDVPSASCVGLIGANGAGKTSLLRGLSGLESCGRSSRLWIGGERLDRLSANRRALAGLGHVLEHRHLFPQLSIRENLDLGMTAARNRSEPGDLDRILELFPDIKGMLGRPASSLSGGQQQFVAIARALMGKPHVLLMDEPTVGLAPRLIREVIHAVRASLKLGTAVLLVEQRLQVVQAVADTVYILVHGKITHATTGKALDLEAHAQASYLS